MIRGQIDGQPLSLRPVIVLVTICVVEGLLLGMVHGITAPVAQQNADKRAMEAYMALVPDAESFQKLECNTPGCTDALKALDESDNVVGYVIVAESKGYGGPVPVSVAFDATGHVANIMVMSNSETPGLGTRVANDSYIGQYVGLEAAPVDADSIDMISGATISSKAALAAFNIAVQAYEEVQ
ncbi:MAG: FMN-binding protein [Coriobacteriales bacterium]|nr:FMN-binding protein [Coriobacteriales bacterium]